MQRWFFSIATFPLLPSLMILAICPTIGRAQSDKPAALTRPTAKSESDTQKSSKEAEEKAKAAKEGGWTQLLPEEGLEGWEISDFGTNGKVYRDGKTLVLERGDPLTGVTYKKKDFPTDNFEISVQAKRIEGNDFLCGLTFPVADEFCSLIAGGWGGGMVGLSSVDGFDASENATSTYFDFKNDQWYEFRVRVEPEFVRVWIDNEEFFRQERENHEFSTRLEVYASQPLGYCVFESKVAIRDLKWRPYKKADQPKSAEGEAAKAASSPEEPIK